MCRYQEQRGTYLSTITVANGANFLHAQGLGDVLNRGLNNGVDVDGLVLG